LLCLNTFGKNRTGRGWERGFFSKLWKDFYLIGWGFSLEKKINDKTKAR